MGYARAAYQLSERRACRIFAFGRSTIVYRSRKDGQAWLRRKIRDVANSRPYYGYRRIHVTLRREGYAVNLKRVHRLYVEEGLAMRKYRPKRRVSASGWLLEDGIYRTDTEYQRDSRKSTTPSQIASA